MSQMGFTMNQILDYLGYDQMKEGHILGDIPVMIVDTLVQEWARGTLPGEMIRRLIVNGEFGDFIPGGPGVSGTVGATGTGGEGVAEVEDYVTARMLPAGPEETIRQQYEKILVDDRGIEKQNILIEVPVQFGASKKGLADIVVYRDAEKRDAWIVVEITAKLEQGEIDQGASYANVLDAEYLIVFDGKREIIMQKQDGKWVTVEGFPTAKRATGDRARLLRDRRKTAQRASGAVSRTGSRMIDGLMQKHLVGIAKKEIKRDQR